ncbi:MAG TPA: ABC transporter substrate-binding protein [Leptospiraceae bacterium]|nr:ABC transporter substrate-binding protein [Leptospiraceae bacterium]HMW03470.1 ABC transporter substrate-binding protein [Leptospiraceae bacterium]HMX31603.1 ABC transporter substrate-binding protein [Leptospiraceae bacterium]HMY29610.1 ABC transporter substrate-binding protein [Leptospiraceae bacterium]HMZ62900.1 ABC transporter substrate-binding protein [Leptospiraceae bacterium]
MKIGIVKHLNARPLTYGFEKTGNHTLVFENPSVLKDLLLKKELDLALISSVECIRNESVLSFSTSCGVCAKEKVRSILFFKNKKEIFPSEKIYTDSGSRSSVALLQTLLRKETNQLISVIPTDPKEILTQIENGFNSHLLFGDNALLAKWNSEFYEVYDLAEWWYKSTGLSFIFAFWAFPKSSSYPDSIFLESLEYGISHIGEIIETEKRFPREMVEEYLKKELHYKTTDLDISGFSLFKKLCTDWGIL